MHEHVCVLAVRGRCELALFVHGEIDCGMAWLVGCSKARLCVCVCWSGCVDDARTRACVV